MDVRPLTGSKWQSSVGDKTHILKKTQSFSMSKSSHLGQNYGINMCHITVHGRRVVTRWKSICRWQTGGRENGRTDKRFLRRKINCHIHKDMYMIYQQTNTKRSIFVLNIFFNEDALISLRISLHWNLFLSIGSDNGLPIRPLSEQMLVSLLTHICVTRPQDPSIP